MFDWCLSVVQRGLAVWSTLSIAVRLVIAVMVLLMVLGTPLWIDLWGAIPQGLQHTLGHISLLVLVFLGVIRVWQVRNDDDWPTPDEVKPTWPIAAVSMHLILIAIYSNLFVSNGLPRGDWDLFCQWHESVRRTVAEHGQFPWWNPWVRGGFPLAGEPQCGVVTLTTPLVLVVGTTVGLRLAVVLHLLLTAEGMRRLTFHCVKDLWAAACSGLLFACNGSVLLYVAGGPQIPLSLTFLPWVLLCCFRLGESLWWAVALGVWVALSVLGVIQYLTAYTVAVAAWIWMRGLRVSSPASRINWTFRTLIALGVFLTLAGWRLVVTGNVLADFPRHLETLWDVRVWQLMVNLVIRPQTQALDIPTIECCTYVGPVAVFLALCSLRFGFRWWHWLAVIGFWLSLGAYRWYHPSYWLADWPGFATMHVVTRWRLVALVGLCLAVAQVLYHCRKSRQFRWLPVAVMFLFAVDFGYLGFRTLPQAFSLADAEQYYPGQQVDPIVNIESWELAPGVVNVGDQTLGFPATRRGYGVIRGNEPQFGYDRSGPTARLWRGHPDYTGEIWTDDGPVQPTLWTPNQIVVQVEPEQVVYFNQNPGDWWVHGNERPFPEMRCAEWNMGMAITANERGLVDLRVSPPNLKYGWGLSVFGLVLTLCSSIAATKTAKPRR